MRPITRFRGVYRFLSNFFEIPIKYEGVRYPSVEHAYQAMKVTEPHIRTEISKLSTPGKAKRYGGSLKCRIGWNSKTKTSIMKDLLKLKFAHTGLREMLVSTGERPLTEQNFWHDNFWGDCQCDDCTDIKGKSTLGVLLMEVREELKNAPRRPLSVGSSSRKRVRND